ncbi:MAG TPA: endonuclease/exonuclease/phosphatase family protein, partial [Dongiaceae bacterium]|nr:endonuclease/exonuclease/phosphatase family protein [Dongiaceae bacterium]
MTDDVQQRPVSWPRLALHYLGLRFIWSVGAVLIPCQAVIWLRPLSMWPAVIEQFAVQFSLLAAVALIVALSMRRWIAAALFAILLVTFAWPLVPRGEAAAAPADPARLKIVSANLWYNAADYHRTLDFLMRSDADVIGLVEVIPAWREVLAPLIAKYPYKADCADIGPWCETLLLSKLPIVTQRKGILAPDTPAAAGGDILWGERRITILATHFTWPLQPVLERPQGVVHEPAAAPYLAGPLPNIRQAEQADAFARLAIGLPPVLIVMGDFNSAPWSRVQHSFRAATGLNIEA